MTIIVGNANNVSLREVKCYLENHIDCNVSIAGDKLIGAIDDQAIRQYTLDQMHESGEKWLKEVFHQDFDWSD